MTVERTQILTMLSEGKITVEEAEKLLEATGKETAETTISEEIPASTNLQKR